MGQPSGAEFGLAGTKSASKAIAGWRCASGSDNHDFSGRPMQTLDSRSPPTADATRFVLLNTSHPGNVGSTARAMKVMGFSDWCWWRRATRM